MPRLFDEIISSISKGIRRERKAPDNPVAESPSSSSSSEDHEDKIYCRSCGRKNPASRQSCQVCGMRTDIPPSEIMKVCNKCGSAVNDDDAYCFRCGSVFSDDV
jgi:RNA polymerase subunit RPABC4/transcription elongation factor Spt4